MLVVIFNIFGGLGGRDIRIVHYRVGKPVKIYCRDEVIAYFAVIILTIALFMTNIATIIGGPRW